MNNLIRLTFTLSSYILAVLLLLLLTYYLLFQKFLLLLLPDIQFFKVFQTAFVKRVVN